MPVLNLSQSPTRSCAQRGMSLIGGLLTVALIASAVTLVLKLGPLYIDAYTVKSVIEDLPRDKVHEMSKVDIFDSLQKRFKVNNLRDFKPTDVIKIERGRDSTLLKLEYEQREHLFLNVDIVLTFSEQFEYQ